MIRGYPPLACMLWLVGTIVLAQRSAATRPAERLGRGFVAVKLPDDRVYLGWRLLATDPVNVAFNVYRSRDGAAGDRLNASPLTRSTDSVAEAPSGTGRFVYSLRAVVHGEEDGTVIPVRWFADEPARPYLSIPMKAPEGYHPNDASAGDLDGDGEYELVVHQVGRGRDNSQAGATTPPILQAYKLDGTFLWEINFGPNIREGAHYTQFNACVDL